VASKPLSVKISPPQFKRKEKMKKVICLISILFFSLILSLSCKKETPELSADIQSSDEALYKLGEQHLFPKSFYAQRAKLAIADSYFKKGDEGSLILAASEYREFISLFPLSPSAAYAQYQIAMTFYKKALKPGRDQTKTKQALAEFKKVITNYPLSEEAKLAQEKIKDCEERLAEHTLSIGELYYRMRAYKASVSRLKEILTNFPNYSKMDKKAQDKLKELENKKK